MRSPVRAVIFLLVVGIGVGAREARAACPFLDVNLNTIISGALTTTDCPLEGSFADNYRFFAQAGTYVTAQLGGELGTVLLSIQDFQSGAILVSDRRVSNPRVALKTPADGFYLVRVWSRDPQIPTGTYRLTLTGVKNPNGCSVDPDPATLCVGSDRFKIQVAWNAVHQGTQGVGTAISLTDDSGSFWFFDSTNVELVIKVLDGRIINGHFWVFYGAMTDVAYTITVTDTVTGAVKTYFGTQDLQTSGSDTSAF